MNYSFHLTKKKERDIIMKRGGDVKEINVDQVINDLQIVWDQDTGEYYKYDWEMFYRCLKAIEDGENHAKILVDTEFGRKKGADLKWLPITSY